MDYVVELDFEGPGFVAVPNAVVDDERLGADALAVLVYLARLAGGRGARIVRVGAICKRFGFGKDKWQRIARELRAVGALSDNFGRSDDGRNVVRSLVVNWPRPENAAAKRVSRKTRPTGAGGAKTCEPENPAHTAENPAHLCRKTRLLKKEHKAARGGFQAAKPRAAAGSRDEKAQDCDFGAAFEILPNVARAESAGFAENGQDMAQRRALAASLGLPYRDEAGQWRRGAADVRECEA